MTVGDTDGARVYAVGDIHGRHDLLVEMIARIRADLARRPHPAAIMMFLGDYVDRGPDSRRVIETLISLKGSPTASEFLLGNHDSYIAAYLEDPDWYDRTYHWLHPSMGGAETLASYSVFDAGHHDPEATRDAFAAAFPRDHMAFLESCALSRQVGSYLFVHAGIRPGVPLDAQQRDDLIWIREPFLSSSADFGVKVVHGHTIVPMVEHHPNRIAIDTGAVRTGILSCLVLEDRGVGLLGAQGLDPWPEGSGTGMSRLGHSVKSGMRSLLRRGPQ